MPMLLPLILLLANRKPAFQQGDYTDDIAVAASDLPVELAKAKAAGLPLTAAELAPNPQVKPSENAAPLIRAAAKAYEALPDEANRGRLYNACAEGDYKAAARYIKEASFPLSLADKAAAMPRCDFGVDWDLGREAVGSGYRDIKMLVSMLSYRAEVQASQGDSNSAVASLRGARRLAEDCEADHSFGSMLVRSALESLVCRGVQRCLAVAKTPLECKAYASFLSEKRPPFDIEGALKGEAYVGITTIRNLEQFGGLKVLRDESLDLEVSRPPLDLKKLQRSGMPTDLASKAYMARHLETWTEFLNLERSGRFGQIGLFKEMAVGWDAAISNHEASYTLEAIFEKPIFDGQSWMAVQGIPLVANRANWAENAALAKVVLYHLEHGSYPPNLQAAGATELDPFTGRPLKYVFKGAKATVFSVGEDEFDNQGNHRPGVVQEVQVASYPPPHRPPLPLTR